MEQRTLRLGDLVDDYCPRERRVTNHIIVAMVEHAIRQTRCSTCDTEHVFKAGRLPRRRVKDTDGASVAEPNGQPVTTGDASPVEPDEAVVEMSADASSEPVGGEGGEGEDRSERLWPANRTLIRAQLPRVEGEQPPPRPIPEFTIYQRNNSRNAGGFRRGGGGGGGGGWSGRGGQEPNGNHAGNERRNGHAGGAGFGTGQGEGQGRRRHGKRRPR